jgi:hypothetical protein
MLQWTYLFWIYGNTAISVIVLFSLLQIPKTRLPSDWLITGMVDASRNGFDLEPTVLWLAPLCFLHTVNDDWPTISIKDIVSSITFSPDTIIYVYN